MINIVDQRVVNLTPFFTTYTITKSMLWTLTQTLALALAPKIKVNAIGPGPTFPSKRQTNKQFINQYKKTPLKKAIDPKEIARAVLFILNSVHYHTKVFLPLRAEFLDNSIIAS